MSAVNIPQIASSDFFKKPQLLQDQIDMVYALRNINVQLTIGPASLSLAPGVSSIVGSPPNLMLPLPLKLATPIADSTATAASVSAQLNLLLAALRSTGQLPS